MPTHISLPSHHHTVSELTSGDTCRSQLGPGGGYSQAPSTSTRNTKDRWARKRGSALSTPETVRDYRQHQWTGGELSGVSSSLFVPPKKLSTLPAISKKVPNWPVALTRAEHQASKKPPRHPDTFRTPSVPHSVNTTDRVSLRVLVKLAQAIRSDGSHVRVMVGGGGRRALASSGTSVAGRHAPLTFVAPNCNPCFHSVHGLRCRERNQNSACIWPGGPRIDLDRHRAHLCGGFGWFWPFHPPSVDDQPLRSCTSEPRRPRALFRRSNARRDEHLGTQRRPGNPRRPHRQPRPKWPPPWPSPPWASTAALTTREPHRPCRPSPRASENARTAKTTVPPPPPPPPTLPTQSSTAPRSPRRPPSTERTRTVMCRRRYATCSMSCRRGPFPFFHRLPLSPRRQAI